MRLLTTILSLYMMVLTFIPCNDASTPASALGDVSVTVIAESNAHDHEHGDTADYCTPFCVCHCCQSPVVLELRASVPDILRPVRYTDPQYAYTNTVFLSAYYGTIWQPPRALA